MKTKWFTLLMFLGLGAIAQPNLEQMKEKREKIEAAKVAYITRALDLTVAESQSFWPVYNEMQDKEFKMREEMRKNLMKLRGSLDDLSEQEISKLLHEMGNANVEIEKLHVSYLTDFIKLIGAKKTAQLMHAEREFGQKMLERIKDGRPDGRDRPAPRPGDRPERARH